MELRGVVLVLQLSWFSVILQSAEVFLSELGLLVSLETLVKRRLLALVVLSVDGAAGCLGKGFAEEVLGLDLRYVTSVAGDVLSLKILCGSTEPVLTCLGIVTVSNGVTSGIGHRRFRIVLAGSI